MSDEEPITFREPSFALFDLDDKVVLTTVWGNLAIFTVRAIADEYARQSERNLIVVPVMISRLQ